MSSDETQVQHTQHGFLVAWGWFAEHIGLIQQIQAVSLKQKRYHHTPQTKVLEFLVAILAGSEHLQDTPALAPQVQVLVWRPILWIRTRQWRKPGDNRDGQTTAA